MKTEKEKLSTAAEWTAQLTSGELTAAERGALTDWMRESPTHIQGLIENTLIANDLSDLPLSRAQIDTWTLEARAAAQDVVPFDDFAGTARRARLAMSGGRGKYWAAAACAVLTLSAVTGYFGWQSDRYSTGLGEQRILTLADGSVVTLNTESTLKIRYSKARRRIDLTRGEAYFKVAQDKDRPFQVMAPDATVKALGTQFNVRLKGETTVVTVTDGRVSVQQQKKDSGNKAQGEGLLLDAGEEVRIDRSGGSNASHAAAEPKRSRVAIQRASAWMQGRVEFERTGLAEVLGEFQRYRKLDILIEDPSLRELKLTGSFDAQDPEAALAYIATISGVAVDRTSDNRYIIRRR